MPPDAHDAMTRISIALDRTTVTGRTALEKKTVHILDAQFDPEFKFTEALKRGQLPYHSRCSAAARKGADRCDRR